MSFTLNFALVLSAPACLRLQPRPVVRRKLFLHQAFSAKELTALPSTNWLTNGGNTYNQRYSPLTQINRFNVQDLKALWTFEMG